MSIEVKIVCPLGSDCERVDRDAIVRCAWYVELEGTNPQTGKDMKQSRCAMAWQPILAIEGNGASNIIASSVQSLRNETVKRQDVAMKAIIKQRDQGTTFLDK